MLQTHKLVIIPIDGYVGTDETSCTGLDLSSCGIPNNIHALQWNNPIWPDSNNSHLIGLQYGQGTGWIEFRSTEPNLDITELPEWALNCYEVCITNQNTLIP
jgi:hypothetical protein